MSSLLPHDLCHGRRSPCWLPATGDWKAKEGSQEIHGVTDNFGLGVQNEACQRLTEFCQENALVIANILFTQEKTQHKRRLYTWTSPNGQYQNQIDCIFCRQRWRSSTQSAKTRPGVDCGSDHELLIAKFRLKLKKEGKTIRPFRYDLNQIPYDYTWTSLVAQTVKHLSTRRETWVRSLGWEDPLEKEMAIHSSTIA